MVDLKNKTGQLFIVGFPGSEPSESFLNFIKEEKIGGVILFKDNCPTHQKARDNIEMLQEVGGSNLFIAIDQEGGRVSRLSGAPAEIASAWTYGNKLGLEKFAEDYIRCLLFMESLGININLAPVADIFLNDKNKCLDSRCFGDTVEKVIPFVSKAIELSAQSGLISCCKHFPGLGASEIDPHEATAKADYDEIVWEQREQKVFDQAISSGVDMVMTTHLLIPAIDKTIVTGSEKIVKKMLRGLLGFEGLVITDDLNMSGAAVLGDIGLRTKVAFNAGHDLLLFGQDFDATMVAYDYFCDAIARDEIKEKDILNSLERVEGLKLKLNKSMIL